MDKNKINELANELEIDTRDASFIIKELVRMETQPGSTGRSPLWDFNGIILYDKKIDDREKKDDSKK